MLACKHCSTPNSLDSTFCKRCGTAVPADQKREATLQLDKLVDEGLGALNAGRTSEALAIADTAVATDPTHLGALHLKSAVHERRGEIADALESAERIVELSPDSELDRIKRNGLRNSLLDAATPVRADRRVAFAAAAAAMVLVACAGVLVARRAPTPLPQAVASNAPIVDQPVVTTQNQAVAAPPATVAVPTDTGTGAVLPPPINDGPVTPNGRISNRLPLHDGPVDTQLPDPNGQIGTQPVLPPGPTVTPTKTTVIKSPPPTDGPDPKTLKDDVKEDPGQIEISVSHGPKRTGGSIVVPETRTNGSAAYARVGTERFELGDYAGAATNLEKAVSGGGDAVELNRRLAQAYSRLGRNSDAASAYQRCRDAADAAIASGRGDKDRLQAARAAADAGLKTVKGG